MKLKIITCLLAFTLILNVTKGNTMQQEKEVFINYRKGEAVKHIPVESKLHDRLIADGWEAEVHDQPPAPKRGRKAKKLEEEGDGLPELHESEE